MAASCITPICDNRILTLSDAKSVDFGGHCSFIHCPGIPMEEVLQNFARGYDKDPEHTSAILAVPKSDYNRLWNRLWHWKTLKTFKKGEWIFNQYESGELPRKCGLNAAYRILYCDSFIPEESVKPILEVGNTDMSMMFQASVNNNKCRVGMDTMCQGPGFITKSFCENASPPISISLVSKNPAATALPTVLTSNGAPGLARGFASVQMVIGGFVSTVEFVVLEDLLVYFSWCGVRNGYW
jgi:hypothetical protein